MDNEWKHYATVIDDRRSKRLKAMTVAWAILLIVSMAGTFLYHRASLTDILKGVEANGYVFAVLFLFGMGIVAHQFKSTRNVQCRKCGNVCEKKETGQIYLVCHQCKIKYVTGFESD